MILYHNLICQGDEREGKFPQFLSALGIKVNEEEESEDETPNNNETGSNFHTFSSFQWRHIHLII